MSSCDTCQITNVLNLYGLAIDTQCWDLFDRVLAPDSDLSYPPGPHWISDVAAVKRDMKAFHEPLDGSVHTITNHQVIVDGDHAHAISYVVVRLMREMPEGENTYETGGWYDDTLVRTAAGWRIKTRVYLGNWWRGNPRVAGEIGAKYEPNVTFLRRAAEAGKVAYVNTLTAGKR